MDLEELSKRIIVCENTFVAYLCGHLFKVLAITAVIGATIWETVEHVFGLK